MRNQRYIISVLCLFMLFIAGTAHSAEFWPNVLTISGSPQIHYAFDDSEIAFPITLTGTPASVWLVINTKDKSINIKNIQNGNLGWHYVNNIDTTVYISGRYEKSPGHSMIVWDGRDETSKKLYAGAFNYYLWAYDSKTPSQKACNFISTGFGSESQFVTLIEKGPDGMLLARPLLFGSIPWQNRQTEQTAQDYPYKAHGTVFRWSLGSDPNDITMLQTTRCPGYGDGSTDITYGGPVLNPLDYNVFYHCEENYGNKTTTLQKWEFVAGGYAIKDEAWSGQSQLTREDLSSSDIWSAKPSCYTDGNYIYIPSPGINQKSQEWNKLRVYAFDGYLVMDKMMHEWYMPYDENPDNFKNGLFDKIYSRTVNNWLTTSHYSCMHEMIDTTRLLSDQDDEYDMIMWRNSNGDYFLDSVFSPFYDTQWYCLTDDKNYSARPASASVDRNGFNIIGVSYFGLTSFAVSTQDGTGIGYMQFADDTPGNDKFPKLGGVICDTGSAFDGIYFTKEEPSNDTWVPTEKRSSQSAGRNMSSPILYTSYVAFDSFKGIITDCFQDDFKKEIKILASEENNPSSFSVSQNTPNPFNPTTSIDIDVPSRNIVKAEIYNISGQKVSILADGVFEPGRHTLTWNASGFSAGVYFCRIIYGNLNRTIKMSLVK